VDPNCTCPACDLSTVGDPLLEDLFASGLARPDSLRLGLDVAPDGSVINSEGRISGRVFAVGPLRRGALWETTAVPEIRGQAAQLAARISADSATLQMASAFGCPSERAWWSAARVSAVSPDCEITTTRVRASGTESR